MKTGEELKIGDTVYFFDVNYRVYPPKKPGDMFYSGPPIYRKHWREREIVGETSRSWVVGPLTTKIPKKGPPPRGWLYSPEDVERNVWINDHRRNIVRAVEKIDARAPGGYELLRQMAELVGYKEEGE
ncbi:MAG: hypothetical protein K2Y51_00390 [Gammaproteobacteria bacterium]|nr:hypothetical protein [Gammaproteobacteria bacterium]